jgi:hypothetical protein
LLSIQEKLCYYLNGASRKGREVLFGVESTQCWSGTLIGQIMVLCKLKNKIRTSNLRERHSSRSDHYFFGLKRALRSGNCEKISSFLDLRNYSRILDLSLIFLIFLYEKIYELLGFIRLKEHSPIVLLLGSNGKRIQKADHILWSKLPQDLMNSSSLISKISFEASSEISKITPPLSRQKNLNPRRGILFKNQFFPLFR